MGLRWLVSVCLACSAAIATAQTTGQFYLEKTEYAVGEPVFVYFLITNIGQNTESIYSADPYHAFSAYQFRVSSDQPGPPCTGSKAISGGSGHLTIGPGEKHVERVLLNFAHRIDKPGQYTVEAERLPR